MTRLGKRIEITENNSGNNIRMFFGEKVHNLTEREFLEYYQEYMQLKYESGYQYIDKLHVKNGRKDHRSVALDCIQHVSHNLWRSWNEAASFDEVLLDELLLWVKMLDELRPTFGCLRFYPNQWVNERIIRIRSQYPKWVQEEFDFWYQMHQNDMEEKKKQWEKPGEK